jgi:hypothetical protein
MRMKRLDAPDCSSVRVHLLDSARAIITTCPVE